VAGVGVQLSPSTSQNRVDPWFKQRVSVPIIPTLAGRAMIRWQGSGTSGMGAKSHYFTQPQGRSFIHRNYHLQDL